MSKDRCLKWERSFRWEAAKRWTVPGEYFYTVRLHSPDTSAAAFHRGKWAFFIEQSRELSGRWAHGSVKNLKPLLANGWCPRSAHPERSCKRLLSRLLMGKVPSSHIARDPRQRFGERDEPWHHEEWEKTYLDLRGRIPPGWSAEHPPTPDGSWECTEYDDE